MKKNLFGLHLDELEDLAVSLGEAKYRGKQLHDWLYKKKIQDLRESANLPKSMLQKLKSNGYEIVYPEAVTSVKDYADETEKFLFRLPDGELVESVLMKYPHGYSACLSTQVGCAMGCTFCASGKDGKVRDLSPAEIALQMTAMENLAGVDVSNIVLMGMGEPLDNYDNVIEFIRLANEDLDIGQRHITLSTCGIIDKIDDLAELGLQINLAISLHSPFQEVREKMMPVAKTNPLDKLIRASKDYFKKTGRRVTYEYTVIDGVNNRPEDAKELKYILGGGPHHINLIGLNTVNKNEINSNNSVNSFSLELNNLGLNSTIRKKNGANIEAACGQLRRRH